MDDTLPDWVTDAEAAIVEQFDRLLAPIVAKLIASHAAALTADAGDELSYEWQMAVDKLIEEGLMEVYLTAAIEVAGAAPTDPSELFPEVVNTKAIAYQTEATKRVVGITDTLWADLNSRVVENLTVGMDIKTLTKEVEAIGQFATSRSRSIARTETLGAYNGGDWDGAQALGEFGPTHKRWLATTDGRERDSHREANGQVVPMDEPFKVGGGSMMRPHALGAPAGEVVNCRCTTQMFWPGDKLPEGSRAPDGSAVSVAGDAPLIKANSVTPSDGSTIEPWAFSDDADVVNARIADLPQYDTFRETTPQRRYEEFRDGRTQYSSYEYDRVMTDIARKSGADGKPTVLSSAEFEAQARVVTRRGFGNGRAADQFLDGDYEPGVGLKGNGFYSTQNLDEGNQYATKLDGDAKGGRTLSLGLREDARIISIDDLDAQMEVLGDRVPDWYRDDPNRWALAQGYDAVHVPRKRGDWYIMLNRASVLVDGGV